MHTDHDDVKEFDNTGREAFNQNENNYTSRNILIGDVVKQKSFVQHLHYDAVDIRGSQNLSQVVGKKIELTTMEKNSIIVGGNVVVEVYDYDYRRGVVQLKYSVIRRIFLQHRDSMPTTMEVKTKLIESLKISNVKVIPLGKGLYHILLHCLSD